MRDWQGKRYWVVGASEGLGRALAHKMSASGAELVLSARSEDRLNELAAELPGKTQVVPVDVRDMQSVKDAVATAGHLDGMVYLAAVYWPQGAKKWNPDEVELMCDINYTGGARCIGAAIGPMIERDEGHIVICGSISVFRGLPGSIGYTSSKAGLASLAESMQCDLVNTGVDVQIANPGYIKSRLTDKNTHAMPFIMEPEDAAQRMFEHMNTDRFKTNYPFLFSSFFRFSMFWPDWLYYRVFGSRS